jgi:3,4-dihydroxy 2-butanone 4-phosphate synthase/GTP cyclohydrolase II
VLDNYQRVEAVLAAFAAGDRVVTMMTTANEGDLFVAASLCTPERWPLSFAIRRGSYARSRPSTPGACTSPMVAANDAPLGTAFTVSVDCRHGLTTEFRRRSAPTLCAPLPTTIAAAPFVRPGHVFPLIAKDGGVLMRSGHTEACIDLPQACGFAADRRACRADERRRHRHAAPPSRTLPDGTSKQISIADLTPSSGARQARVGRIG